jgi:hypothetical protein
MLSNCPEHVCGARDEAAEFSRAFTAIALAADDLAQRTQRYRLLLSVPSESPSLHFASWVEVAKAIEALEQRQPILDDLNSCYARGVLHALHIFARVRDGASISYLEQVRAYLELSDIWVPEDELASLRDTLLSILAQQGLPGELAGGLRAWEARQRVPADGVDAVARPLIAASHDAALASGIPIPSHVEVSLVVHSTPYYAYARYHCGFRGTIELSSDIAWTAESIKHSICHEAFPGHQGSAAAREVAIAGGDWGPLVLPGLANSPTSPISEGLAENGTDMIGWIVSADDELFAVHNALTFGVLTNAAVLRHEHGEPQERVIDFMITEAGVSETWARYQYRFLTDPLWHTSFPHYWHGAKLIRAAREQFRGREEALYQILYGRPQTAETLRRVLRDDAAAAAAVGLDGRDHEC